MPLHPSTIPDYLVEDTSKHPDTYRKPNEHKYPHYRFTVNDRLPGHRSSKSLEFDGDCCRILTLRYGWTDRGGLVTLSFRAE